MSPCLSLSHSNSQAQKGTGRVNSSPWFLLGAWDSAGKCILEDPWVPVPGTSHLCSLQTRVSCSQQQMEHPGKQILDQRLVVPACKAPGEPGAFSSAFPAGILLEGGRGSPWTGLRRMMLLQTSQLTSLTFPKATMENSPLPPRRIYQLCEFWGFNGELPSYWGVPQGWQCHMQSL